MAATNRPDVLSLVVYSGEYDKVHYALVLASSALALGSRATLFFTMDACRALLKPEPSGAAAWRKLALAQPTAKHFRDGGAMDDDFKRQRLANFEELLAACVELGARVIVCELGLKARGLASQDLRGDVPIEIAGVATLLEDASKSGAMLFI